MVLRFRFPDAWSCECGREHHIPLREIVIEEKSLPKLRGIVDRLDIGDRCLIVEDAITRNIAGRRVKDILENGDYLTSEAVIEKADVENARRISGELHGYDFCVAVGGGAPIDVAKIAAHENNIPFLSVPTALSHDGIASQIASITQNRIKASLQASPPIAVIADLDILSNAPERMISAGFGDVIAKTTSLKDWELGRDDRGEYYCERAARLVSQAVGDVIESSKKTMLRSERVKGLAESLLNSSVSMIIAGSSRPASGSEHLFSHFLDRNAMNPAMHGEQCGIGAILMAKYHEEHNPDWWKQSELQWPSIKRILQGAGLDPSLKSLGISQDLAIRALVEGANIRPERYTILHKRSPSVAEAQRILEETSVM